MLAFVSRIGPPEAMTCPVLLCDWCLRPIQGNHGNEGMALWTPPDRGAQRVAHVHKGACDRSFDPEDEWSSMELDAWLAGLDQNIKEPFPDEDNVEYVAPRPSTWRQGHYERSRG